MKYTAVYDYYKRLMLEGTLCAGEKMPSVRKAILELQVSRTTIETAYFQLSADGYIESRPRSGYYVTYMAEKEKAQAAKSEEEGAKKKKKPFDSILFEIAGDSEGFCFELWQKYMKNSLRQSERLLSYSPSEGELDLRIELAKYVKETRNIICSADNIIIGSGTQSLLRVLVPIISEYNSNKKTVSIPTGAFLEAKRVFEDYAYDIGTRDKERKVIYVAPAHMTEYGDVMPVKRRMELIKHAKDNNHLIIEDDYENELVFTRKPTPSLYALSGGENVVYIGSFSKMMLPSIRISFMILPAPIRKLYIGRREELMQTASKTEQIALAQFLRDGHLSAQIRKIKRLYAKKRDLFIEMVNKEFGSDFERRIGDSGTEVLIVRGNERYLLSCSSLKSEKFEEELSKLHKLLL